MNNDFDCKCHKENIPADIVIIYLVKNPSGEYHRFISADFGDPYASGIPEIAFAAWNINKTDISLYDRLIKRSIIDDYGM